MTKMIRLVILVISISLLFQFASPSPSASLPPPSHGFNGDLPFESMRPTLRLSPALERSGRAHITVLKYDHSSSPSFSSLSGDEEESNKGQPVETVETVGAVAGQGPSSSQTSSHSRRSKRDSTVCPNSPLDPSSLVTQTISAFPDAAFFSWSECNATNMLAVLDSTIYISADGGATFTTSPYQVRSLSMARFANKTLLYALPVSASSATILISYNCGNSFQSYAIPKWYQTIEPHPNDSNRFLGVIFMNNSISYDVYHNQLSAGSLTVTPLASLITYYHWIGAAQNYNSVVYLKVTNYSPLVFSLMLWESSESASRELSSNALGLRVVHHQHMFITVNTAQGLLLQMSSDMGQTFMNASFSFDQAQDSYSILHHEREALFVAVHHGSAEDYTYYLRTSQAKTYSLTKVNRAPVSTPQQFIMTFDGLSPDGCSPFSSSVAYTVVIVNGNSACTLSSRLGHAMAAKARALLVIQDPFNYANPSQTEFVQDHGIPVYFIGSSDGQQLITDRNQAGSLSVTINYTRLQGSYCNVYYSNVGNLSFSLSLPNVFFSSPSPPVGHPLIDLAVVDFVSHPTIEGIFFANAYMNGQVNVPTVATVASYDGGHTWNPIVTSASLCNSTGTFSGTCFLHLALEMVSSLTGLALPYSSPAAPTILMAHGIASASLNTSLNAAPLVDFQSFVSLDGGRSWSLLSPDQCQFGVANYGKVLFCLPVGSPTTVFSYSLDLGSSGLSQMYLIDFAYPSLLMPVLSNGPQTRLSYQLKNGTWHLLSFDFSPVLSQPCVVQSLTDFSILSLSNLGVTTQYAVPRPCSLCFIPSDSGFNPVVSSTALPCGGADFVCAPGFVSNNFQNATSSCALTNAYSVCQGSSSATLTVPSRVLMPGTNCSVSGNLSSYSYPVTVTCPTVRPATTPSSGSSGLSSKKLSAIVVPVVLVGSALSIIGFIYIYNNRLRLFPRRRKGANYGRLENSQENRREEPALRVTAHDHDDMMMNIDDDAEEHQPMSMPDDLLMLQHDDDDIHGMIHLSPSK